MIFGKPWEGLKFPDICLIGEEKPREKPRPGNISRARIEPGALRDNRACYRLLHCGGLILIIIIMIMIIIIMIMIIIIIIIIIQKDLASKLN